MKVILFGATGMVGQGVLRECLLASDITEVLSIRRSPSGQTHDKLRERLLPDPSDLSSIASELSDLDACFFCLGVSSAGMKEVDYRRVTYDLTLAVAGVLAEKSPGMTFLYVSGAGTDGTERGRSMWARVKGETENALLKLPFKAAYMFRPGFIRPLHGITSKTWSYRVLYAIVDPIAPLLGAVAPDAITTTERLGQAMLNAVRKGAPKRVLEMRDINELAPIPG
jgi:uncharacterized protein YbjT (DUF2867 family)